MDSLHTRTVRKVYLVTYSQVDKNKSSDKETFCQQVIESFDPTNESKVKPVQWAACEERHDDGGTHYHMAIKFNSNKRWASAALYLRANFGVHVNFSNSHHNYMSAYRYVLKEDEDPFHSPGHPNLDITMSPQTSKASNACLKRQSLDSEQSTVSKRKSLSKCEVMDIIQQRDIHDETELLALAAEQANDGLNYLKAFIANTPERTYKELITKTWKMQSASKQLQRKLESRMERLHKASESECIAECENKVWLKMANEVLKQNSVSLYVFADAVRTLLTKGRGKHRNIMITGPSECGKTFLLRPLELIYDTFVNPSSAKYAFVGVENREVIFLNDLRWNSDMIPWQEFLNLLEGQTVHLAASKTHYAQDICVSGDVPLFATSIAMIKFNCRSENVSGENAMMETRWRLFQLFYSIPKEKQIEVEPCPRCFAELIFMGSEQ